MSHDASALGIVVALGAHNAFALMVMSGLPQHRAVLHRARVRLRRMTRNALSEYDRCHADTRAITSENKDARFMFRLAMYLRNEPLLERVLCDVADPDGAGHELVESRIRQLLSTSAPATCDEVMMNFRWGVGVDDRTCAYCLSATSNQLVVRCRACDYHEFHVGCVAMAFSAAAVEGIRADRDDVRVVCPYRCGESVVTRKPTG